jgi:hypothetical protein
MKKTSHAVRWLKAPQKRDYEGAQSYLMLLMPPKQARKLIDALREAKITSFQAKDILRASGLPTLGTSEPQVRAEIKKVRSGTALAPLLLVRDAVHGKVIIADGYHRLCAADLDEHAPIPCRIV